MTLEDNQIVKNNNVNIFQRKHKHVTRQNYLIFITIQNVRAIQLFQLAFDASRNTHVTI